MISVVRYFFIVLNAFHIVVGALIACFGFWLRYASPIREVLISYSSANISINLIIASGIFFILFGLLGSFGDVSHNKKILGLYLFVNALVLILEITVLAYGYTQRDALVNDLQSVWVSLPVIYKYLTQDRFNCCGFAGPSEYNNTFDVSCLQNETSQTPWNVGCATALSAWANENLTAITVMVVALLVISLGQLCMSSKLLWNKFRTNNTIYDENDLTNRDGRYSRGSSFNSSRPPSKRSQEQKMS